MSADEQALQMQRLHEENQFVDRCMKEGVLLKSTPVAVGMFTFFEYRKKFGHNSRHWLLNGLISGAVGVLIARMSNFRKCHVRTLEQFPDGRLAKIFSHNRNKTDQNQMPGYEASPPFSHGFQNVQRDDESSVPDSDDTSGSGQYEEKTYQQNNTRGLTFKEARARYREKSYQQDPHTQGDSQGQQGGFFTDNDRRPTSNTGKNKYGDSWDTSG